MKIWLCSLTGRPFVASLVRFAAAVVSSVKILGRISDHNNQADSEKNLAQSNNHDDDQTINRHDNIQSEHNNRKTIDDITNYCHNYNNDETNNSFADSF
ncbi:hypothetical protein DAPPUDRAFT_253491 [Daphnia pulex]|uniref:Uncharacterized protein n=1 Tax=Daphnia pulex TaxID=6669 RepID=E9H4Y7_DAPPU|nr:hypothetical protein DAPPUDRAFT_253491 [Daphnia pulex]|eukprot:EFX73227.1 hypothetical protein DAPPUDRAFT_253491 [Daphnia pulex]